MTTIIDVQYACNSHSVPNKESITTWAEPALAYTDPDVELVIRIVDLEESKTLNERWRQSQGATNVLSFPAGELENISPKPLGDIVICGPIVATEAEQQGKAPDAHWAHMIVHGILHLLGYDHIDKHDADTMEALEVKILNTMGYDNPYN